MIFKLLIIILSGLGGAALPYFTLDECKGKAKWLTIISNAFLIIISSVIILSVSNLTTLILGAGAGAVLMFTLRLKIKQGLVPAVLGLGIGLTNNLIIAYLSMLYLIPAMSLKSLKLLVKKKNLRPVMRKTVTPLIIITVSALTGFYLITVETAFFTALTGGALLLASICNLTEVLKK